MKKLITGITMGIAILSLAGCSDAPENTKDIVIESGSGENAKAAENSDAESKATDAPTGKSGDAAENVTLSQQVLVEQNGVKITATGLEKDFMGTGIQILIENTTGQNLGVSCNSTAINGYMMENMLSCNVAAGKSANDKIYLMNSDLEQAEISTIAEAALSFHVFDSDSYEEIFNTPEILVQTSAYGTVEQPKLDEGSELYNQNGVRIVGKYVEEGSIWGTGVVLFIENAMDKNIVVQCDNMSINGYMMTPYFSCQVNAGKMALDDIAVLSTDLEANNITSVDTVEVNFKIAEADTYAGIGESGPVSFSAK